MTKNRLIMGVFGSMVSLFLLPFFVSAQTYGYGQYDQWQPYGNYGSFGQSYSQYQNPWQYGSNPYFGQYNSYRNFHDYFGTGYGGDIYGGNGTVLQVGPSGQALVRGTVEAIGPNTFTLRSWGGTWQVNFSSSGMIPQGLAAGAIVQVRGTSSLDAKTISAQSVRIISRGTPVPPPGNVRTITTSDNNTTIHMRVGDTFNLDLSRGNQLRWHVTVDNAAVLSHVPTFAAEEQGLYRANSVGTATLNAVGSPNCAPGYFCAQYTMNFTLRVIVET